MSSKYSDLTEEDVRRLVNNGVYTVETIELVRDNGTIVRHLEATEISPVPSSVLTYNIYNQTIQEVNLDGVVRAIANDRNRSISDGLTIQYDSILNNLAYYRDHGSRLDPLNSKSLDAISPFEFQCKRSFGSLESFWVNPDEAVRTVDAYANIIFIYIMSGYWLHGCKFSDDSTSISKLEYLENGVRHIYQQLLINWEAGKELSEHALINSVYAYAYLDEKVDVKIINDLVQHDSRCNTALDFFESFSEHCIEKKYLGGSEVYKSNAADKFRSNADGRLKYATQLHDILTKIENIKGVIPQLRAAGQIDESHINLGVDFVKSPLSIIRVGNDHNSNAIGIGVDNQGAKPDA
ncbi:hypothetical protein [Pseudomonas sivasensis]|uniref:hypothetical protein n=1 Tax=Pseudomonas sivasensis TaxID=1880678 RepID=UPI0015C4E382|nr:hypothetical protein [Pseudomonas sivasensis]